MLPEVGPHHVDGRGHSHLVGHHHLTAVRRRHHARRTVDGRPEPIDAPGDGVHAPGGAAGVDADAHQRRKLLAEVGLVQRLLHPHRGAERVLGPREGDHEAVPRRLDLVPLVGLDGLSHQHRVLVDDALVGRAQSLPLRGGTLDVGEKERHVGSHRGSGGGRDADTDDEHVAVAVAGEQVVGLGRVKLDLFPEPPHGDVNGPGFDGRFVTPDLRK